MKETKPLSVVIAYAKNPPIMEHLKTAFERAGVEAHCFDVETNSWFDRYVIHTINKQAHNLRIIPKSRTLFDDHPLSHLNYRGSRLLELIDETGADLVLLIRGTRFTEKVLREVRGRSMLFGWWIEREGRVDEPLAEAALFDHYFFISRSCLEEGRRRGVRNTSLLRHSVDTGFFRPLGVKKRFDWCFVGSGTERRRAYIRKALEVSGRAAIYGKRLFDEKRPALPPDTVVGRNVWGADLVRLYNETRVVIDVSSWSDEERRNESGINMRVLEVPACGSLVLTDGSEDLEEVLTPGVHIAVFDGLEDFEEKLHRYINDDYEREKIAVQGLKYVALHYSYDDTVRAILETFRRCRGKGRG